MVERALMPRRTEPTVSDGYGVWIERVIGNDRRADPDHRQAGSYGYFEKRTKRLGLTVKAKVYPDFGVTSDGGAHLWGVVFPAQSRLTTYDPKTDGAKETRPYAAERRFGAKAASREEAMRQADECIKRGGWDALPRHDNGTLKSLDPDDIPFGADDTSPPCVCGHRDGSHRVEARSCVIDRCPCQRFEQQLFDDVPDDA